MKNLSKVCLAFWSMCVSAVLATVNAMPRIPLACILSVLSVSTAFGAVSFTRDGARYRLDDGTGFVLEGRVGGRRIFHRVSLRGQRIGSWNMRIHYDLDGRRQWLNASRVEDVRWDGTRLTVRTQGRRGELAFAGTEAITPIPGAAGFRAEVLEIANTGTVPLPVKRVYFEPIAPYAGETPDATERPCVRRTESGTYETAWRARDGRAWGARTTSRYVSTWNCWLGSEGSAHPDLALILDVNAPLAPGARHVPAGARGIAAEAFAVAGTNVAPERAPAYADQPGRPRLFIIPEKLRALRPRVEDGDLTGLVEGWRASVRARANESLPPEPDWLPKGARRNHDYAVIFRTIRPPCAMMQRAGLVFALTGDPVAGAEAKRRVLYYFGWDPKGPSGTFHNDEPAMSIVRNGTRAYDWTYALYTPEERALVETCLVERARQIYALLRRHKFHENPRNSHLGRQIGFLAEACCAIMPEHPEMRPWYDYVMDIYRRVYPAWGGADGGWNEGPHYWCAYMDFGLDSLTAVKYATGDDVLAAKPFFRETPWYYVYQCPPGSPISPFGDGWQAGPQRTTVLRSFAVLLKSPELLWLANRCGPDVPCGVRDLVLDPELAGLAPCKPANLPRLKCFPDEGLVMSHSSLLEPKDNVAFYFRSTPYGAVSHGHADQNAFCLSAYGEPLAINSGYYNYWGSPHHFKWMRSTKATCAITFDDGEGQPYSARSAGKILRCREEGERDVFAGDASAAYGTNVTRAVREVVRVGADVFVLRDTLAAPGPHRWEYNLHAKDAFRLDAARQRVTLARPKAVLDVQFLTDRPLAFSQTDRFETPVEDAVLRPDGTFPNQHHFRAATAPCASAEIVSVLAVRRANAPAPLARAERRVDARGTHVTLTYADGAVRTVEF